MDTHYQTNPRPDGIPAWSGVLALEAGVPPAVQHELVRRGHCVVEAPPSWFGGYQAVARDSLTGVLSGASESRKDGCALGY